MSSKDAEMPAAGGLYPAARRADVVDDYHGTRVADPYRWLEDAGAADTLAWVDAQNTLVRRVVDVPRRAEVKARLTALYDFPRTTAPERRGERYVYTFHDGTVDQPVLMVQDGLDGEPRVLLDPNTLSEDGTIALTAYAVSPDGVLVAYALSHGGSDWQDLHVREVATGRDRDDRLQWAKFTNLSWTRDSDGFFYTRFPEPGTVPAGDEHYLARVCFHQLGTPQSDDRLIAERPGDRDVITVTATSTDGRWLVLTSLKGASDKSEVSVVDLSVAGARPQPLVTGFDSAFAFADAVDGRLYFRTDHEAPLGRVIAVDVSRGIPAMGPSGRVPMRAIVPAQVDTLSSLAIVRRQLVAVYLRQASDHVRLFTLDGAPAGEVPLPSLGSLSGLTGRVDDEAMFLRFSSFTEPPTVYRFDFAGQALTPFGRAGSALIDPSAYEVTQAWYPSTDGTRVSMFLVHKKGLVRDGLRPTLLTGYGGFNISLTPKFDPSQFLWLDGNGVIAVPNLRGGGEYGEAWHQAGVLDRKQHVFDDFIAAAEWLIAEGYTRPSRVAIEGGSNGGLLVGAVMVQRPDLFGAVVCRVPVADMLRYHRFTVGRFWIPEYGSAEDPAQFPFLYAYSPLHNVRDGVAYPPTLITTADTDDRVDPGMAKKFAARLQAAVASNAGPILIRVDIRAGHGAGKPVSKQIDEEADIFTFVFGQLR
ncbi:MAG: prolyl oligopeptidase family serine peptidase [Vicinamibacterales bacterium]|nr:prolyl oligopeptidase family serine peptidase [Vicinamibacterales bacterium]